MIVPNRLALHLILATGIASLITSARGGTIWDGGGLDDNWGTGDNWNPNGTPPVGSAVDLTFDGVVRLTSINNYAAFDDFRSLTFAATAGTFTLSGSAIDLFGKIENYSTATQTVSFDLAINAAQTGTGEFNPINGDLSITSANVFTNGNTLRVYGVNGKTVTFGAGTVISQGGAFNVEQASNVVFLGNNTYTGTTNILAGSLTVGNGGTTGALGTGTVTVASGATLTYNRSDAVTLGQTLNIGGALVKNGAGALTISGAQTGITGTVAINAGRITMGANDSLGTAAVTLNGGTIERNAAGVTVANNIVVGASGGTILGRQVVDDYTTFSGQVTGSAPLTIQGLVALSNGANTYAGDITISNASASYLRLVGSNRIGATSNVTLAGNNANLRLDGTGVTQTIAALNGSGGSIFVVGSCTLTVGNSDASGAYAGTMNTGGGPLTFVKTGTGTQTMERAAGNGSAITGVTISGGTLQLAGTAIGFNTGYFTGATPITVTGGGTLAVKQLWNIAPTNVVNINGGTLNFNGTTTDGTNYVNNLTLQNGATVSGPGGFLAGNAASTVTLNSSGDMTNTISTNLYLVKTGGITTYVVNVADGASAVDLDITGRIFDLGQNGTSPALGGMILQKTGAGALRASGNNTYVGGTVLSQGALLVASNTAFSSGTINIGDAGSGANPLTLTVQQRADISNPIVISASASGLIVIGADNSGSGANAASLLGQITANRAFTFRGGVVADRLAVDGKITGSAGTITIDGGSRVSFSNTANDFTGNIVVTGAGTILQASVATAAEVIPNGSSVTVDAGAVLQLASSAGAETINALNGAGTVRTFSGGSFGSGLVVGSADGSGSFSGSLQNGSAGNPLALTKLGTGTQTLTGANTFTGSTIISGGKLEAAATGALGNTGSVTINTGGTLLLGGAGSNRVNDGAGITLNGGTFDTAGLAETVGALTLSLSSIIDMGAGAAELRFADSSALAGSWSGVLSIYNWTTGTDHLYFGNGTGTGLQPGQLDQIKFYSDAGTTILPYAPGFSGFTGSFGEVVPVPEPSSVAAALGLLGLVALRDRRKVRARHMAGTVAVSQ